MDKRDQRFIRILEELQSNISDQFSEILNGLDKEHKEEESFKRLSVGMRVVDDLGVEGVIQKIDGPHFVVVDYNGTKRIHCMDPSCFHYDRVQQS